MTEDEIRIAIARECGFDWTKVPAVTDEKHNLSGYRDGAMQWVPDYPYDLGAMHDVVKILTPPEKINYTNTLFDMFDLKKVGWDNVSTSVFFEFINATALQRAKAFLMVKGLWKRP